MANIIKRLVPKVRLEAKTGLGSGTNTVYALHLESEDKAKEFYLLWGTGAPSTDYDTAPSGSLYIDIAASGKVYNKNTTSGWTAQT